MTLKHLKSYFENTENPKFYLTDVFSWRGIYNEVVFTPSKEGSREESLYLINEALNGVFTGYKGGCYTYNIYTKVYFENNISSCDDLALYQLLLNQ